MRMVKEASSLTITKVDSEFETLLLEAKLIHKFQPKYNSVAKDDKHPLYITITNEKFPRVTITRRNGLYGPFPSSSIVHQVLKMIRRIFPYSDHKIGKRPCLYSQIGLCSPCPSTIKNEADRKLYLKNIRNIKSLLNGRIAKVRHNLEKEMQNYSREQKYEEAQKTRDKIDRLEYITKPRIPTEFYLENPNLLEDIRIKELQNLKSLLVNCKLKIENLHRLECYDIAHLAGTHPTASMVTFIDGEAEKTLYRHFKIKSAKGGDDYESLREVAKRRLKNNWGKPDLIIVDGGVGQVKAFEQIIPNIPVVGIAKNPDRLIIQKNCIRLTGPALNLVSRMRDEAHRFARRYHHKLVKINLLQ